jgi:predicted ABC-type ATPase
VLRVRQRVLEGGHDIPRADIIRRYSRSLANLEQAARMADEVAIFDNTDRVVQMLFQIRDGAVVIDALDRRRTLHRQLADVLVPATRP